MMSLPRELSLVSTAEGLRLVQKPVVELQKLRRQRSEVRDQIIKPSRPFIPGERGDLLELKAEFQMKAAAELVQFGIRLQTGDEESTVVGYQLQEERLFIDRTRSGVTGFSAEFPGRHEVKLTPLGDRISLHIFLDRSGIELFANDGLVVMSDLVFPTQLPYQIEVFAVGDTLTLRRFELYLLDPANQ
jgi:fructan beta-fructosidase